jgi:transposase-like protein
MRSGSTCASRSPTETSRSCSERGLDISYATVRSWVLKFRAGHRAAVTAAPSPPERSMAPGRMVVRIAGLRMYLWRAVDHEGEVLDMLAQRRRDTRAALRLMRKLLRKQGFAPKLLVTDKLPSCGSAFRRLRLSCPHEQGLRSNNRAENAGGTWIGLQFLALLGLAPLRKPTWRPTTIHSGTGSSNPSPSS